ncbi:hypothetical protein [Microcoleus sp. Pol12B4]|uniref:hypothetical protein n=1 Tax=Microcoleus sp. Pol12B4 TaxID=3055395 RepID=UPI002FD13EA3
MSSTIAIATVNIDELLLASTVTHGRENARKGYDRRRVPIVSRAQNDARTRVTNTRSMMTDY